MPTSGGTSNYFSDPLLQQYVRASQSAMGALMRPTTVQAIPTSNPTLDSAIAALQRLTNAPDTAFNYMQPITAARVAQLNQPGYTANQLDAIRTQATNPLLAQRDAARQSIIQRFASQGMGPDSGPVQQALLDLDRTFAQQSTTQNTSLAINAAQQDLQRQQEAEQLQLETAGLAGRNLPTQASAASGLASLGNAQQQIAAQNSQMDLARQNYDTQKILQSMGLSQNLAQLPIQLQGQTLASLNALQGPIPSYQDPTLSALLSLAGLGQSAGQQAYNNQANLWSGIGGLVPSIINALPTSWFGGGSNSGYGMP
jgi:hypothetical protein